MSVAVVVVLVVVTVAVEPVAECLLFFIVFGNGLVVFVVTVVRELWSWCLSECLWRS